MATNGSFCRACASPTAVTFRWYTEDEGYSDQSVSVRVFVNDGIVATYNPQRVVLMPEGTDAEVLRERAAWIVELCKQEGYRFSPRLHIDLYGNRRGV